MKKDKGKAALQTKTGIITAYDVAAGRGTIMGPDGKRISFSDRLLNGSARGEFMSGVRAHFSSRSAAELPVGFCMNGNNIVEITAPPKPEDDKQELRV